MATAVVATRLLDVALQSYGPFAFRNLTEQAVPLLPGVLKSLEDMSVRFTCSGMHPAPVSAWTCP